MIIRGTKIGRVFRITRGKGGKALMKVLEFERSEGITTSDKLKNSNDAFKYKRYETS